MLYRELTKNSKPVSLLGYGCMRFPLKSGVVDKELAFTQMKLAFDNGVNYYDTAYIYHGGKSEIVLGEFAKKYNIRDKIFIADKLPAYLIKKHEQLEKYFSTQLKRLDTNYIDYYLMHTLGSLKDWISLKNIGIIDFINNKKKSGEIKYIGFSFHGKSEEFIKILEDYEWDFCQIQFNYLDENNQAGLAGLKRAYELGIGVVVMEPLRGGGLADKAPDKVKRIFSSYEESNESNSYIDKINPKDLLDQNKFSPAYFGLRFVMNYKEVSIVLSGMNDNKHIKENIQVASITEPNSMTKSELNLIKQVKEVYAKLMKVPCTGCAYCMPCPTQVDIPSTFNDYNSLYFFGKTARITRLQYLSKCAGYLGQKAGANLCISCGKCTIRCPQNIDIPAKLKEAHKALDNIFIRFMFILAAKFLKRK